MVRTFHVIASYFYVLSASCTCISPLSLKVHTVSVSIFFRSLFLLWRITFGSRRRRRFHAFQRFQEHLFEEENVDIGMSFDDVFQNGGESLGVAPHILAHQLCVVL